MDNNINMAKIIEDETVITEEMAKKYEEYVANIQSDDTMLK